MKVNNTNIPRMEQNQQVQTNKQMDYEKMVDQQTKFKISDREDSLEMLNKHRNEFKNMDRGYTEEQMKIANLQVAEFMVYRTASILNNIKSLVSDATDERLDIEDRKDIQFTIDDFTKDVKSISLNIERGLGIDDYNPEKLGIEGVVGIAKMGKVTIKTRHGRSERISVSYTGKQNRTVIVDSDKNTGNLRVSLKEDEKKEKYQMDNKEFKAILEDHGFFVEIEDGGEFDIVEEGFVILENTKEFVGLNVTNEDVSLDSLDRIKEAIGRSDKAKFKLSDLRDELEIKFRRDFLPIDDLQILGSKDEIHDRIKMIKDYIYEENQLKEYISRMQNPDQVYHLLK